jgi:hypothetical protein
VPAGIGGDLAEGARDLVPAAASLPGRVGGGGQVRADGGIDAVAGSGQGAGDQDAVVAGDGAGLGGLAGRCHGQARRPRWLLGGVPGQVTQPFGGGDHAFTQAWDGLGGFQRGALGQGVDGDGGQQVVVGGRDRCGAVGGLDRGAEYP